MNGVVYGLDNKNTIVRYPGILMMVRMASALWHYPDKFEHQRRGIRSCYVGVGKRTLMYGVASQGSNGRTKKAWYKGH